jgi:ribonuclease HII
VRLLPTFILEDGLSLPSDALIAGVDEVGRGPLAGPVVASAVIINRSLCSDSILCTIDDSKRLSHKNRNVALTLIRKIAIIDELNILWASMLAMERAIEEVQTKLDRPLDAVLVDGNRLPNLKCPGYAIVKGDTKSISIAAASIVAKTTRDDFMLRMAAIHPEYGWEKNMGYGTQQHLDALKKFGPTEQHRQSFRPVLATLKTSY